MIRLLLRVLGPYAGPLRRALALMSASAVLEGLSYATLLPLLRALFSGDAGAAVPWLVLFAVAVTLTTVLRHRSDVAGFSTGAALSRALHHRIGDHLVRLPLGWFTAGRVGDVAMLTGRSVLEVMSVPAHRLQPLISGFLTPATAIVVLLAVDWRMGLAALAAAPLIAAVYHWTGKLTAAQDDARARGNDEVASRVIEFVRAQPVLRVGGRTTDGYRLLDDALEAQRRAGRKAAIAAVPGVLALSVAVQAVFTALLVLGAALALGGRVGAPEMLAMLVLAARCVDPLLSLSDLGGLMRVSRGELARIDDVLSTPPLPEPEVPVTPAGSAISFEDVTLRRGDRQVLDGVSLAVPEGGTVAIVGFSGAGKSSMLQLIARFHDVDGGAVRVGGVDVREIGADELMSRISVVFQDVYLFAGTIEDNVRLGKPDATAAEVRAAAAVASLDEVVDRLPLGWATPVGDGGASLSGGERQRVSVARAVLKDAPILLLDEATSALDPENEAAVQDGVDRLMRGRTVVMVTHRLRTVENADHIVFLADGKVVEQGTHHDMLRTGRLYSEFWQLTTSA